jgi:hypothetical protein
MKDLDDFCRRCTAGQQPKLAMRVTVRRLQECKSAWAEDRQGHGTNMKFAILAVEMVRSLISTHLEALRDTKSSEAADARVEVVETLFQLGFGLPPPSLAPVSSPVPSLSLPPSIHPLPETLAMEPGAPRPQR